MVARVGLRAGLVLMALAEGLPGVWAAVAPGSYYAAFPTPGRAWLTMFPPFNEHLVRDFGLMLLQFAVVLAYAAVRLEPRFARVIVSATLLYNVPHLIYHQLHRVAGSDLSVQLASQVVPILLAVALLVLCQRILRRTAVEPASGAGTAQEGVGRP